jgi:catechol-2,3-dioxygenase
MGASIAFSHLGIHVRDLALMERFYSGCLELTVTDRGELDTALGRLDFVFLSSDPKDHHQIVLAAGRPEHIPFNVINQISFKVENFAKLRELHRRSAEYRVTNMRPLTHGNAVSLYFGDPEGNRIELFCDTPWYVDQPMVIPMDMSQPDDKLWAWIEATARRLPGFKPVEEWQEQMRQRMAARARGAMEKENHE